MAAACVVGLINALEYDQAAPALPAQRPAVAGHALIDFEADLAKREAIASGRLDEDPDLKAFRVAVALLRVARSDA